MTVPVPSQLVYSDSGDGVTTTFSFPVRFLDKAEVVVLLRDVATGVDTKQVLGSDYTIAGSSWPTGGNIVFNTAPPVGTEVIRYRETVAKQVVDLANTQRNDAEAVETQLDRLAMVQQDQKQELARALKADFGEDGLTVERVAEGHFWLAGPGGRMVDGGSAEDIINAQGYAAEAKDAQSAAEAAQLAAEDAADRAESAAAGVEYPVSYEPQALDPSQQEQARENIGATEIGHALFTAASKEAARDAIGAADAPVITDVRAVAYDMHFRILRGQGWTTGEAGGVVAYELASPAAAGATSITLTSDSPKPIASQLLAYLGEDGEYYSAVVSGVSSNTVNFKTPLEADIAAGENVFNFYINESHPNTYGYRAIADDMLRSGLHACKEVFRGAPAAYAGTATVAPYNVDNAANAGSSAGGGYKVTPSQDNGGCHWTGFVAPRTGRYRAEIHCNRGGGVGGQAVTLYVLINGAYKYSKVVHSADVSPTFIDFSVMDGNAVEFRALKNQQYDFFISDLIVYERDGAGINLEAFKSGRHFVFGDSWAAVSTDIGQGIGVIDRLRERFPSATFVNKGVGGNKASDLVSRFDADIAADVAANGPAKTMLVICGTNDYYGAVDPIVFGDNLGIVAAKAVALGIAPIMFTSSVGSHLESPARFALSRRYALEVALVDRSIDTLGALTFTPVLRGATSAGTGTYTLQQGRYRRSGKQIDFAINLNWSAHDGTGAMEIIGLPLPASGLAFPCTVVYGNLSYTSPIQGYVSGDKIVLGQAASGAGFNPMAISSAGLLYVSGTYFTA